MSGRKLGEVPEWRKAWGVATPTVHREGCWYPKAVHEGARYAQAWPDHCRTCNGEGGFSTSFDPSPAGVSLSSGSMMEYDPCTNCLERSKCPRCAGGVIAETYWDHGEEAICENCGYIEGRTRGRPYVDEPCSCLEPDDWHWRQETAPY